MKCYLCGSANHHKREGKVRDNPNIEILECNECGLVFLDTQNTDEKFYAEGNMHNQAEIYKLTERTDFVNDMYLFNKARLDFLLDKIIGKNVLDFGSGYAGFLLQAQKFAKSITGVELEEQVKPIYEKHNIPLLRSLDECKGGGHYDIITAFHVIEHLKEPIDILKQLVSLLHDNGKLIIEVPNADDALLTIYKNKAFSEFTYWSPHLYLYNPHTLKKLAQKANLRIDFIKCIQRYPLSNTLYWLGNNLPAGQKKWGHFLDNELLQRAYEDTLASLGATDTLIAQFSIS
ncbi:methyltransferase [Campylobacter sp. MIT 12-5580]|uniref:class I SAM-dependent methyltransferase n=1 Tax=Campylobacter sp. MIT 12-5580 TaxID=2040651 RepID=UPI0010F72B7D|nr:class I SAM-dependent methyltransferase [Campylobacter sp. MIT 12-5580]TKX29196.1 methyltransferase [Campylobacter sp. MIT 12-5580]